MSLAAPPAPWVLQARSLPCPFAWALGISLTLSACGSAPVAPAEPVDPRWQMLNELNASGQRITLDRELRYNDALTVEKYVLQNGLTLLFLKDAQAPVFSYQTWFRVGSGHEKPGKTGIAHLFEHLMFKETKNTPAGVFDRTMESLGARTNAATWLDWTFYYEDVPRAHLDEVIRLEADRMEHMILNSDQLESEREVVINERRERVDNDPDGKLSELLWATAYTQHPYKHPTIGWMPDIEGLSLEDCLAFYSTWYAPNNAVLVVVGDVDRDHLLKSVVEGYGHMKAAEIPASPSVVEPRQTEVRRVVEPMTLSTERLLVGWHALSITDERHAALEVLNEILCEGDSARLQRALITDGEIAAGFSSFVPAFRDPGLYELGVDLRPGHTAEQAEAIILTEMARLSEEGVTEAELAKALNKLETRFFLQLQTAQQKAQSLGFHEATSGDFTQMFTASERYQKVTREAVQSLARDLFRPDGRTVVIGRIQTDEDAAEEGAGEAADAAATP